MSIFKLTVLIAPDAKELVRVHVKEHVRVAADRVAEANKYLIIKERSF